VESRVRAVGGRMCQEKSRAGEFYVYVCAFVVLACVSVCTVHMCVYVCISVAGVLS
jgi:hypothetical protein